MFNNIMCSKFRKRNLNSLTLSLVKGISNSGIYNLDVVFFIKYSKSFLHPGFYKTCRRIILPTVFLSKLFQVSENEMPLLLRTQPTFMLQGNKMLLNHPQKVNKFLLVYGHLNCINLKYLSQLTESLNFHYVLPIRQCLV